MEPLLLHSQWMCVNTRHVWEYQKGYKLYTLLIICTNVIGIIFEALSSGRGERLHWPWYSANWQCKLIEAWTLLSLGSIFFFLSFCHFLGCSHGIWRFPGYGINQSCSCQPMSEPEQRRIWATSVTYTTSHGNTGLLTHWAKGRDRTCNLMVPSQIH